jgi:hypothetical protein
VRLSALWPGCSHSKHSPVRLSSCAFARPVAGPLAFEAQPCAPFVCICAPCGRAASIQSTALCTFLRVRLRALWPGRSHSKHSPVHLSCAFARPVAGPLAFKAQPCAPFFVCVCAPCGRSLAFEAQPCAPFFVCICTPYGRSLAFEAQPCAPFFVCVARPMAGPLAFEAQPCAPFFVCVCAPYGRAASI